MKKIPYLLSMTRLMFVGAFLTFISCEELTSEDDDDDLILDDPIASFQFEVDAEEFFKVTFTNFSQNATVYAWDFGDDKGVSVDENPVYTYMSSGTYEVTLTASNAAGVISEKSEMVTVTDPGEAGNLLSGSESKTWKLFREGTSMSLGANATNPAGWWAGLTNDGSRNCLYEHEFIFHADGSYEFKDNGGFWGEFGVWPTDHANYENCFEPNAENMVIDGVDVSSWASGTHSYEYDVASGKITLKGKGAWIGISKLGTTGEHGTSIPETVAFNAVLEEKDGYDLLYVTFDYGDGEAGGGGLWSITYVSYDDWASELPLAAAEPAPAFSFNADGLTVTFSNTSARAESYMWDFGDGNTSTEENPIHTYASEGNYTVKLSATGNGFTNETSQEVAVSEAKFGADALVGNWTMDPIAGSLGVGPAQGDGSWWAIDDAGVVARDCFYDDVWTFDAQGNMSIAMDGSTWVEGWQGGGDACGEPIAPHNGSGSYTYTATETEITISGKGGFIGLAKVTNTAEIASPDDAAETITYMVSGFSSVAGVKYLTLDVAVGSNTWWRFKLKSAQ